VLATTALVASALDGIVQGNARCAFACVRPPGDHAILPCHPPNMLACDDVFPPNLRVVCDREAT
jgi:hypothetical protein